MFKSTKRERIWRIILALIFIGLVWLIYPVAYTSILNNVVYNNDITRVNEMLEFPGNLNRSNGISEFPGDTPLVNACKYGHLEIAETLINHGADVNYYDGGWSAITVACAKRNPNQYKMVKLLIESGADLNTAYGTYLPIVAFFELKWQWGNGDLNYDDKKMTEEVFFLLVDSGADIYYEETYRNSNLLYLAAKDDALGIVKYLIEEAGFDVDRQTLSGETPLMGAALYNSISVAEYLLSMGANPRIRNRNEETALDYTMEIGDIDTSEMQKLLQDSLLRSPEIDIIKTETVENETEQDAIKTDIFSYVKNNEAALNSLVSLLSEYDEDVSVRYENARINLRTSADMPTNDTLLSLAEDILINDDIQIRTISYVNTYCIINVERDDEFISRWLVYKEDKPDVPGQYEKIVGNWYYREVR